MSSEDDPRKLRAENKKLLKELKDLIIEKNLMEDRMYRSFHQLLQSKKRKISMLEGQLKRLKGDDDGVVSSSADVDEEVHCETCQCNRPSKRQRLSEEGESRDSSEAKADVSGSETDYSDETDLDEEPASKSSSNNTSPSKSVKSGGEPEAERGSDEASTSSEAKPTISGGMTGPGNSKEGVAEQSHPKEIPPEVLLNSSTSSDDMDKLMDELCS